MASKRLHEPWQSMLVALDQELTQDTELHCMGGFVLAEYYGLVRATGDVDALESAGTDKATIARLKGTHLVGIVQLYRALGGGWSEDELKKITARPMTATQ